MFHFMELLFLYFSQSFQSLKVRLSVKVSVKVSVKASVKATIMF